MGPFILAIDQGTTSTRCMIFDPDGPIAAAQKEHAQIFPRPGWVEHDPIEIWRRTQEVMAEAIQSAGAKSGDIAAVGIANQRETVVVWDRRTGAPYCNAIVWQDTRTKPMCDRLANEGGIDRFRATTGLPLATYFSGPKLQWILENMDGVRAAATRGDAICGTIDSWLIWNLTGGVAGGAHVIDVTNASRTMLMDLRTLAWDRAMLGVFGVPEAMLPRIVPSIEPEGWGFTRADGAIGARVPVCGDLGDQQAALVGQACFSPGEFKNTYGTGCFLLLNTGASAVQSTKGLLTTVAYQRRDQPPAYALEGSVAVAGALVQWLRDKIGLITTASEIEALAAGVPDNGGVYIVPAFSGLFAPYWRSDARGVIAGLTAFTSKAHLARAALESVAYQTRDVVDAMVNDCQLTPSALKADGGMTANNLLMQFQADVLDVPAIRSRVRETTALGAAYAAGLAIGFWSDFKDLASRWRPDQTWQPRMTAERRQSLREQWMKAVERSLGWEA